MPTADDLSGVDLSLLTTLKELLDTESVTAAARRLGSSQPNTSRSLAKLRRLFGDPLLVPAGRGMQRTALARDLLPRVEHALESVRRLLSPPGPLVPGEERRLVRIAASDYATAVVLHPWIAKLRRQAPGIAIQIDSIGSASIDALAYGELDLAIAGRFPVLGLDQFVMKKLFDDRLVCVVRKHHPTAKKRLTTTAYLALEHVMVGNPLPAVSSVQVALHRIGKARNVVVRVPTFLSALLLVRDSDLAAAVPERFVRASGVDVVGRPLPFRVDPIDLRLMWAPRSTTDPFHRWLREGILAAR